MVHGGSIGGIGIGSGWWVEKSFGVIARGGVNGEVGGGGTR